MKRYNPYKDDFDPVPSVLLILVLIGLCIISMLVATNIGSFVRM